MQYGDGDGYMEYPSAALRALAAISLMCLSTVGYADGKVVDQVLKHEANGVTLTYVQHNPERGDYPCSNVTIKVSKSKPKVRALCVFKDRFDEPFDLRKDVSYSEFENARIDDKQLSFTLRVSKRLSPDSFFLDCVIPYTAKGMEKESCQIREWK
jgi:hypothetical protein